MKRLAAIWLVLGAVAVGAPLRAEPAEYQVIVNAANATPSLSLKQLSRLFLKKELRWPSGFGVLPVDQVANSPVRAAFSEDVLDKSVSQVQSYWRKVLFSGLDVPPPELESDEQVLDFVSQNAGAVGYVARGTALREGVKVLEVTR